MAVLIQKQTVVIRMDAVGEFVPGGHEHFAEFLGDRDVYADDQLIAVGFASMGEAQDFVRDLQQQELVYLDQDGEATDFVVVEADSGPEVPCDWLEFGQVDIGEAQPPAAWFADDEADLELAAPEHWEP